MVVAQAQTNGKCDRLALIVLLLLSGIVDVRRPIGTAVLLILCAAT